MRHREFGHGPGRIDVQLEQAKQLPRRLVQFPGGDEAEAVGWLPIEVDVLGHAQRGNQTQLLKHHRYAVAAGIGCVRKSNCPAVQEKIA